VNLVAAADVTRNTSAQPEKEPGIPGPRRLFPFVATVGAGIPRTANPNAKMRFGVFRFPTVRF
jgi:hypothetical protein